MLNLKQKRWLICTLIAALLLSVGAASTANARDTTSLPTPVESDQATSDTPVLIMTLDGNATAPDNDSDQPNLYQTQDTDTSATVEDNSTRVIAQDDSAGGADQILIAPKPETSPDFTVLVLGVVGVLIAAAAISATILMRRHKAD
jgi:hypothetical protein